MDYYVNTMDNEPCWSLLPGSCVPCDRRLFVNNVMWLHCIGNAVFNSRKDRPEDSECEELA